VFKAQEGDRVSFSGKGSELPVDITKCMKEGQQNLLAVPDNPCFKDFDGFAFTEHMMAALQISVALDMTKHLKSFQKGGSWDKGGRAKMQAVAGKRELVILMISPDKLKVAKGTVLPAGLQFLDLNSIPAPGMQKMLKMLAAQRAAAANEKTGTKRKRIECNFEGCTDDFTDNQARRKHEAREHGINRIECKFEGCTDDFADNRARRTHEGREHGINRIECTVEGCAEDFANNRARRDHEGLAHGINPIKCKVEGCSDSFTSKDKCLSHNIGCVPGRPGCNRDCDTLESGVIWHMRMCRHYKA
jgi:hypothetical protein